MISEAEAYRRFHVLNPGEDKWYWGGFATALHGDPRIPSHEILQYHEVWYMGYDDAKGEMIEDCITLDEFKLP